MEHIDPADVHGRRLALLLLDPQADDEDDEEGVVVHGKGAWDGGHLRFELPDGSGVDIPDAALDELSEVSADVRDLLGLAEYWISLTVGLSAGDVDPRSLIAAGIPWPAPGR